ncbi:hypothetical protein D3C83_280370 [compost metagenome]
MLVVDRSPHELRDIPHRGHERRFVLKFRIGLFHFTETLDEDRLMTVDHDFGDGLIL